jgi:hypothetical protein
MNYKKELNDFESALSLTDMQVEKIKTAIETAYKAKWHKDGPNVDQLYALIAPFIETPEEGFYAASTILSDIFAAMQKRALES